MYFICHQNYLLNDTSDKDKNSECLCVRICLKHCKDIRKAFVKQRNTINSREFYEQNESLYAKREGYTPQIVVLFFFCFVFFVVVVVVVVVVFFVFFLGGGLVGV